MSKQEIIEKVKELKNFMALKNFLNFNSVTAVYGQIKAKNIYDELPDYQSGDVVEIDDTEVCIIDKSKIGIGYTYIKL